MSLPLQRLPKLLVVVSLKKFPEGEVEVDSFDGLFECIKKEFKEVRKFFSIQYNDLDLSLAKHFGVFPSNITSLMSNVFKSKRAARLGRKHSITVPRVISEQLKMFIILNWVVHSFGSLL